MTRLERVMKTAGTMGLKRVRNEGNYVVYIYEYEDFVEGLCVMHEFKGRMDYAGLPFEHFIGDNYIKVRF